MKDMGSLSSLLLSAILLSPPSPLYELPFRPLDAKGDTPTTLAAYRGKVIVLNFWATWCPPCLAELPDLARISRRFASRDVVVIGVSLDRGDTAVPHVRNFLRNRRIRYPNFLATRSAVAAFGLSGTIPQTFFIDRQGYIVDVFEGMGSEDEFAEALGKTL